MDIRIGWGPILSLAVAAAYLVIAGVAAGGEGMAKILVFLIFPLAGIWFPRLLGSYTGRMARHQITRKSPAWAVSFASWILLLAPVIAYGIAAIT